MRSRAASIRRADQGALELVAGYYSERGVSRFNPPGGSGSLGTRSERVAAPGGVQSFNPPGGSGSLGTGNEAAAALWAEVSIRRADQGALEPLLAAAVTPGVPRFQSAGRIREPWNAWAGRSRRAALGCFNPPGGSGSLGTSLRRMCSVSSLVSIRRADQGALELVQEPGRAGQGSGFNPPGGSRSLGTTLTARPPRPPFVFQSAGRIREPWNFSLSFLPLVCSWFQSAGRITEPWNALQPNVT